MGAAAGTRGRGSGASARASHRPAAAGAARSWWGCWTWFGARPQPSSRGNRRHGSADTFPSCGRRSPVAEQVGAGTRPRPHPPGFSEQCVGALRRSASRSLVSTYPRDGMPHAVGSAGISVPARCREPQKGMRMRARTAGLLVGLLVSIVAVALIMKAARGSSYLPSPDDYEDPTPIPWPPLSPI